MANILLLEPDNILGIAYKTALENAGYNVMFSRHAEDAIRQADEQQPDAVILELQLSGHSGAEFLYEFRSYPEWQSIPVILHTLVSSKSLEGHLASFRQLGISNYLYKPTTNLRQLVRAISEILQPA